MVLNLKTGFEGVQEAIERQKSGSRDFIPNIVWKNDKAGDGKLFQHILRFLPDADGNTIPITLDVYDFVTCDDDSIRTFVVPDSVGLEDDDYFTTNGIQLQNFAKEWVPASEVKRTVSIAFAIEREEYEEKIDGRTLLTVRDKIVQRTWTDKDGKEHSAEGPQLGIVKQAVGNFWNGFSAVNARYRGIHDRDYLVERVGGDKKTSYSVINLDPIDGLRTNEEVLEKYKDVMQMSIEDWIMSRLATTEVCEKLLQNKGKGSGKAKGEGKGAEPQTRSYSSNDGEAQDGPVETSTQSRMGSSLRDQMVGK